MRHVGISEVQTAKTKQAHCKDNMTKRQDSREKTWHACFSTLAMDSMIMISEMISDMQDNDRVDKKETL